MHFNPMKIILFAIFSATLAQGQPVKGPTEPPDLKKISSPDGFSLGKARFGQDPIVHVKDKTDQPANIAFVRTGKGPADYMPMVEAGRPGFWTGLSHNPDPLYPNAMVHDPIEGKRDLGHVIHRDEGGNWNHYPANQVPPNVMSESSIKAAGSGANKDLLELRNSKKPFIA